MAEVLSLPLPHTVEPPLDATSYPTADIFAQMATQSSQSKPVFDPSKHLQAEEPEVLMMEDIGFPSDSGISPVAVSKPFQLFSEDAIHEMRSEIFNVRDNHPEFVYTSNIACMQLRGYVGKHAPFAYDAWNHPATLAKISKIAGVDLVPWGNYEIAHINFSTKTDAQVSQELAEMESRKRAHAEDEGIGGCPHEEDKPIVGWHRDSYPFVCVLMLSDCTSMIGGETALLKADGDVERVRGPSMGCAVVLQGRYITHQALRVLGAAERITAVTSFRPKSSFIRDDTVLTTVRPISDLSELYFEFAEYRFEMLVDRFQAKLKELRADNRAGRKTKEKALKKFITEQERFLAHMNEHIMHYEDVPHGHFSEEDLGGVPAGLNGGLITPPAKENASKRLKLN